MRWSRYRTKYSNTADLLPADFMKIAGNEHHLKKAIERDRDGFLELVESLISKTPARTIAEESYQNSLHLKGKFSAFLSELRGCRVVNELCYLTPADISGGTQLPDFTCETYRRHGLDIEVTRLSSWDKMDSVQTEIEDIFNDSPYFPNIKWTEYFHVMPYTHKQISANEIFVEDIIYDIHDIDPNNPPQKVENYGVEIEFVKVGNSSGMVSSTTPRSFPVDPQGTIEDRVRKKSKKQRGYRPLIIFIDSKLSFLGLIDMEQILHGHSTSCPYVTQVSPQVEKYENIWGEYLREKGYLPKNKSGRTAYIKEGEEGIFSKSCFKNVAGVVFSDVYNRCHYMPNFYTNKPHFTSIYSDLADTIDNTMFPNI